MKDGEYDIALGGETAKKPHWSEELNCIFHEKDKRIAELEAEVRDATDLALERATAVCFDIMKTGRGGAPTCYQEVKALKSKP